MNSWQVIWQPLAEQELAQLWNEAPDKRRVTQAVHRLDEVLKRNPQQVCESRGGLRRMAFEKPISILFELVPDDKKVFVLHVGEY